MAKATMETAPDPRRTTVHPIDAFGPACSYLALILLGLTVLGCRARSIRRRIRRRSLAHFTILPASRHSHVRTFREW